MHHSELWTAQARRTARVPLLEVESTDHGGQRRGQTYGRSLVVGHTAGWAHWHDTTERLLYLQPALHYNMPMATLLNYAIDRWISELIELPETENSEHLYRPNSQAGYTRLANLKLYLRLMASRQPRVILVGEAPGYQGSRRTGVPFTSEHVLTGALPEVEFYRQGAGFQLAYGRDFPLFKEPTSTIVWRTLSQCPQVPLLWSAFPHHPFRANCPGSNRTPTLAEVELSQPLLLKLLELFNMPDVVAVGNVAMTSLSRLGIPAQKVRHPAHGGASIFRRQLSQLLALDPLMTFEIEK